MLRNPLCKVLQEAFSLWTRHREQHFCERCKQNNLTLSKDLKFNVPNEAVVLAHGRFPSGGIISMVSVDKVTQSRQNTLEGELAFQASGWETLRRHYAPQPVTIQVPVTLQFVDEPGKQELCRLQFTVSTV